MSMKLKLPIGTGTYAVFLYTEKTKEREFKVFSTPEAGYIFCEGVRSNEGGRFLACPLFDDVSIGWLSHKRPELYDICSTKAKEEGWAWGTTILTKDCFEYV